MDEQDKGRPIELCMEAEEDTLDAFERAERAFGSGTGSRRKKQKS